MLNTDLLLAREASLASMSLGVGLTHIGRYSAMETGYFYSGMYSYCVGLERILKLVTIYDYRLHNDDLFPSNKVLKGFSHRLFDLLNQAHSIAKNNSLQVDEAHTKDSLHNPIVSWLTDFASSTRYYNLDLLTGSNHDTDEPLVRWDNDVCREIVVRHYHPSVARQEKLKIVKDMLDPIAFVHHTSATGNPLNDVSSFINDSDTVLVKQNYSRYYLYRISRFACNVLRELEYIGNFYPKLSEFFILFNSDERSWILKRKTWNPYRI